MQKIYKLLEEIGYFDNPSSVKIENFLREEDGSSYDEVYKVFYCDEKSKEERIYVLKKAKENEAEVYYRYFDSHGVLKEIFKDKTFSKLHLNNVAPQIYAAVKLNDEIYLLEEFIYGENLCKCSKDKLRLSLDVLISMQNATWRDKGKEANEYELAAQNQNLIRVKKRRNYLRNEVLESAYDKFLKVYEEIPCALCHDDLLPFNIVVCKNENRAVIIDWENGAVLPYALSFARLIAHGEQNSDWLFFMRDEDKEFAINYYYENFLSSKNISKEEWQKTLDCFLLYEYCEWVAVGNRYNETDGEYYKKYIVKALSQAKKINGLI